MKYIEKAIKIILSIVLVILFTPFFLYLYLHPYSDISNLLIEIVLVCPSFFICIYAIWSNFFENRKRVEKFIFYFVFLINSLFMFAIAFFTIELGIRDDIHEGYIQDGLISNITIALLSSLSFFSIFCLSLTILMFINNLIFNNSPLKWWNWLIVTAIPLICSIVCLIFWDKILFSIIGIPNMIMEKNFLLSYLVIVLLFAIYLIYDKYKKSKLKNTQIQ